MKIYENLEEARKAVKEYWEKVDALQEEYGLEEECEDSCCATYIKVRYKNPTGVVVTYTTL